MEELASGEWKYLIYPGSSPMGVVVVHEILGVSDYVRSVGEQLSKMGVWAAVVDLFRGRVARTLEEGRGLAAGLKREDVLDNLSRAVGLLRERAGPSARIGTMGFCMGGGYALLGACALDLAFCVDYYGMLADIEDLKGLKGPVVLFLASEDPRVTPWAYEVFLPAATRDKKRVDLHLYPYTRHAFHRPGWEGHDPAAAADAWAKSVAFIELMRSRAREHWE